MEDLHVEALFTRNIYVFINVIVGLIMAMMMVMARTTLVRHVLKLLIGLCFGLGNWKFVKVLTNIQHKSITPKVPVSWDTLTFSFNARRA